MFPNFLRVTPLAATTYPVRINDSTTIFQKGLSFIDWLRIKALADALGFSYKVVFASDEIDFGNRLPNGSWTGAYGMLQRRETDLVFSLSMLHEVLNDHFLLSYPHSLSDVTFITRKPEYDPDPAVFLHPFSIQVWISIIACVCFEPFLFNFLLRKKHSALNLLTSTLGSLVGQGMEQIPERFREYLVLGTWNIGSSFLYYFYAAVLLSFVTFPSLYGVRTFDDLANGLKDRRYEISMHSGATYDHEFSTINVSSFQVIGKCLQESKQKSDDRFIPFLELSSDGKKPAFVGVRADFLPFKEHYFISAECFYPTALVFAMHKEFCCASDLDKTIHRIWASGIFEKFLAQYNREYYQHYLKIYGKYWHKPQSEAQLTMTMLKGPFLFLIFGHSLAFLVFLIEICIGNLKHPENLKI